MKRFFLSIMALSLCAVMSFAGITLPYSEDFEGYGKTVPYSVGTGTTAAAQGYVNHWTKVKVPTGWTVGNKAYSNVTSESPNNGITTAAHRQYVPYVCTNGTGASANPTTGYADKATTYKNATSGYNALRLYTSSTYAPTWAAMPELDASVNLQKVVITANAKMASTTNYKIFVGMSPTANYDASTIVKVGEVGPGKGVSTGATVYDAVALEANLKEYTGTGRYIIFYTNPSITAVNAFLDDIYVYEATCDAPVPTVAGITDNTAQIAIDIIEGYFDIKVMEGAVAAKDVEEAQGTLYDGVTDRPYYINDLQANKQYTAAVRMWCDEMGETKSVWKTISFKTLCAYATLDAKNVYYQTGFEDAEGFVSGSALATKVLPCWEVGNASPGATYSYMPYVAASTTYTQGGDKDNHYLYMYTTTTYPKAYAVLPAISPENGDWSKVEMSFKMTCSATASYNHKVKIGIMNNPLDPSTFVEVAEKEINVPAEPKNGWQTVVVTFENMPQAATGNCIAFMMNYENATSYAYIDDVDVHKLADCPAPNSLEKLEASDDTCAIMWNGKAEKQYLVKWALEKVADEDKAAYTKWAGSQVVTGPQAVIKGLKPNTAYYFTVQTVCGQEEYSEYSADMLLVRTECPEAFEIPYFNDFNSNSAVGSGKNADCWTGLEYLASSTSTSYPYVIASKGLKGTGDNAFYIYGAYNKAATTNTRTYAIAPKMNVADLSQYMVRFYVTNSLASNSSYTYKAGIVVGVTSDPDETKIESNFVALDTIVYEGTTYQQFSVDLSKYAAKIGAAKYVVLKSDASVYDFCTFEGKEVATNNSYAYIDNFEIVVPPCCVQPSLTVAGNAGHSLTVKIDPYKATDSQWQLAVVAVNAPNDTIYFTATTTTYEMTGLQSGTIYNIYARTYCASCGDGMYSDWTNLPVQGRTKDYYVDNYFFGFEDEEGYDIPAGATSSYKIHPALTVGVTKSTSTSYMAKPYQQTNSASQIYAKTGKAAMRLYNYYFTSSEGGSSSTSYYIGQYVILPNLDECSAQKRSIRFNYRQGYHYPLDYSTASYRGKMSGQTTTPLTVLMGLVPKGTTVPTEQNFTLLQEINPQDLTGKVVTEDEQFWETMIYNLTQAEATDYQVCLWWPQDHNTSTSWYFYVDDVQMTEPVNFEIPTITSCIPTDVAVNVAWEEMTNAVNVYVYDEDNKKVGEALNVTENKATVTGLNANTTYMVKVVDATAPVAMFKAAAVTREITTECPALVVTDENPALFTFDSDYSPAYPSSTTASDTCYLWPNCWTIINNGSAGATTLKSYNWLVMRTGYSYSSPTSTSTYYEYGMRDTAGVATNALRLYGTTTASYQTAYAVLPRVKGNINEYVLDFYFRPAAYYISTGKLSPVSPEKKFYVVAMSDVNDLSTADTLYTVEYPEAISTSDTAANDPKGLEYWRQFILPLDKAAADARIAFVQAGDQTCYLFVDNVMIRKPGAAELFTPSNLNAENITKESAKITWESANVGATYLLSVEDPEGLILDEEEINALSYNLTGLTANTTYTFSVKAKKGEYTSEASQAFSFNTACPTYGEEDFVFSFEPDENLVQQEGATSEFLQNSCWIYENLGSTQTVSSLYFPYNHKDVFDSKTKEKTNTFSHSGDYCLELYASRGTSSATPTALGRVITPEIEGAAQIFSQKVLKFYYRAIYHNSKTGLATTASNGVTYGRGVIVGVCSDPNDEATFQALDTLYYTLNPTSADMTEENDYAWMKGFVKLDQAVGNHIWMMPLLKDTVATVAAYGRMYIDDMSFSDPMPILTTAVNDQTMGKVTAGDAYAAGDPVTVEATANYNYKFVDWSDGATENPYTFNMPASDYTITANFAPKAIKVSDLEGESFENETTEGDVRWVRVPGASADGYRQIAGWVYSNAGTSAYSATNYPYNIVNTFNSTTGVVNNQYSRTGDYALRVYSAANETYRSYVATPEISDMSNLAGKQIEFYMRPLYCYGAEYSTVASRNKVSTTYATDTYSKAVIVGTCSNPKDPQTFHPLKTVFYSKNVTTSEFATEENNYLWEKQVISMANVTAGDKYIYFEAGNLNSLGVAKACYMYIDDIAFGEAQPTITVESSDLTMGTVTGSGSYDAGSEVIITAEAKYNHHFVEWNDGDENATRTIVVDEDATYTATFALDEFNAVDINETFEAEEGGVQRWTRVPGATSDTYKATEAWTYGNSLSGTTVSNYPYNVVNSTSSKYSYQGDYALRLYANTTHNGYVVTPKIEDYETSMEESQFSFYMKPTYTTISTGKDYASYLTSSYAKTVYVGTCTNPNDISTFTYVDTITYDYDADTYQNPSADNNFNWQKVTVNLKNHKAPYVFIEISRKAKGEESYAGNYGYMYVDNISFITPVTVTVETEDALKGSAVVVGDATVEAGQNVTIKAVPEDTYVFDAWKLNGEVVSNDVEYTFALSQNQTYTATFKKEMINVQVTTEGNGTVNITDYGTSADVEKYSVLTLTATADQNYQFVEWTDGNQENPRQVSVTEAKIYTATFDLANYKILAYVDAESDGMGTVAVNFEGDVPAVNKYYAGSEVTLTATANEGYVFVQWNDGNTDNPRQVVASADSTFYASFKRDKTVVRSGLSVGELYTICQPQNLTEVDGAVFYEPESWDGFYAEFVEATEVKAGYGYLLQATADKIEAVLTGDVLTAPVADAPNGMQGTAFNDDYNDVPEGNNYCGLNERNHWQYFGKDNQMRGKRAYLVLDKIGGESKAPANARRLRMAVDGNNVVTGLDHIMFDDKNLTGKFIIDGQLIIMKNGVMYNAQGKIIR